MLKLQAQKYNLKVKWLHLQFSIKANCTKEPENTTAFSILDFVVFNTTWANMANNCLNKQETTLWYFIKTSGSTTASIGYWFQTPSNNHTKGFKEE